MWGIVWHVWAATIVWAMVVAAALALFDSPHAEVGKGNSLPPLSLCPWPSTARHGTGWLAGWLCWYGPSSNALPLLRKSVRALF